MDEVITQHCNNLFDDVFSTITVLYSQSCESDDSMVDTTCMLKSHPILIFIIMLYIIISDPKDSMFIHNYHVTVICTDYG